VPILLLLHGDADPRSAPSVADPTRLVVMRGVGHLCSVEAAEPFSAEVRNFLRSVKA
jgi:pimeloyl-ACP methyl ester carboxylesterase